MWVHCPRASNGLLPRRSNLVGYVRWDAQSDRFPPCQTIIPTAFRSQSEWPVIRPESRQGSVAGYERYRLISPTIIVFCFFTVRCSASLLSYLSRRTFMNELDRRSLLKAITAVPFAYCKAL